VGPVTERVKILVVRALMAQPQVLVLGNDPVGSSPEQTDNPAAIDDFSE
jgi:ABC-type arginine transport system ATPase subunit